MWKDFGNGNLRVSESNQTCLNCRAGADSRRQSRLKGENGKRKTANAITHFLPLGQGGVPRRGGGGGWKPENSIMGKIETEKQTVEAMIRLYCKGKKHRKTENGERKTENYRESSNCPSNLSNQNSPSTPISPIPANRSSAHPLTAPRSPLPVPPLCPQCQALLDYAHRRLEHCKFGEDKPSCTRCPVHCYKPAMREQIRQVMRYSGPRMLMHDPIMAIRHLWDFLRAKFS